MKSFVFTRREFLKKSGAVAALATAGVPVFTQQTAQKKVRVVLARNRGVVDNDGNLDATKLESMFDEAVAKFFGTESASAAWSRMVHPDDIVGIKTNLWKYLHTPPELEQTMKRRLMEAGVREENIAIDDHGVLKNPTFQKATALINVRPMRAHNWAGVGGCLKNYIMFVPKPSDYHPDSCIDLGAIWKLPHVAGKTRLNVLLMLTPQFNCLGPHHFDKEFTWQYKGLLVGTDPVALDAVGLKIIEAQRRLYFKEDSPMRPPVRHIRAAEEKHGVGVANLEKIEITKLGWMEDALI
jgi:hypothetical protein